MEARFHEGPQKVVEVFAEACVPAIAQHEASRFGQSGGVLMNVNAPDELGRSRAFGPTATGASRASRDGTP